MSMLSALFLGLLQGISEFLPISSSGHLSLFQNFFGLVGTDGNLFFDVLLHLGTLIAIFVYYWRDILALLKELGRLVTRLGQNGVRAASSYITGKTSARVREISDRTSDKVRRISEETSARAHRIPDKTPDGERGISRSLEKNDEDAAEPSETGTTDANG